MLKYFSFLLLTSSLLISCGNDNKETEGESYKSLSRSVDKDQFESAKFKVEINNENLTGSWVNSENNSGFELSAGGIAVSINNEKLEYKSWELIESKLVLSSVTKGGNKPLPFKEIYNVRELYKDALEISPSNYPDRRLTFIKK